MALYSFHFLNPISHPDLSKLKNTFFKIFCLIKGVNRKKLFYFYSQSRMSKSYLLFILCFLQKYFLKAPNFYLLNSKYSISINRYLRLPMKHFFLINSKFYYCLNSIKAKILYYSNYYINFHHLLINLLHLIPLYLHYQHPIALNHPSFNQINILKNFPFIINLYCFHFSYELYLLENYLVQNLFFNFFLIRVSYFKINHITLISFIHHSLKFNHHNSGNLPH